MAALQDSLLAIRRFKSARLCHYGANPIDEMRTTVEAVNPRCFELLCLFTSRSGAVSFVEKITLEKTSNSRKVEGIQTFFWRKK
jgi:hypothetical protein